MHSERDREQRLFLSVMNNPLAATGLSLLLLHVWRFSDRGCDHITHPTSRGHMRELFECPVQLVNGVWPGSSLRDTLWATPSCHPTGVPQEGGQKSFAVCTRGHVWQRSAMRGWYETGYFLASPRKRCGDGIVLWEDEHLQPHVRDCRFCGCSYTVLYTLHTPWCDQHV